MYTGEPEVDGCGYMLKIVEEMYKPLNLSADFQMDSLKVSVTYFAATNNLLRLPIAIKRITK